MQSLKPRCAGCGTGNAIDADYCMECGIKFIREKNNENSLDNVFGISAVFRDDNDMSIPNEPFEEITIRKGLDGRYEDEKSLPKLQPTTYEDIGFEYNNGKYEIFDGNDNNKILFESSNLEEAKERLEIIMKSMNIQPNNQKEPNDRDFPYHVVRNERGKFIPASQEQIDNLKHAKKITNTLDYLRIEPNKPILKDKRLDFRSMEIPDWEFGKSIITQKVPIITQIEQAQTWPDKMVAKTSGLDRPFPVRHVRKPWGGGKCDCDGIKSICDEFRAKQEKAPYSAIIGTDVRKGIGGRKRPKKQNPTEYITIKKDYNSKFKYVLLMGLFVISIYTIM